MHFPTVLQSYWERGAATRSLLGYGRSKWKHNGVGYDVVLGASMTGLHPGRCKQGLVRRGVPMSARWTIHRGSDVPASLKGYQALFGSAR